MTLIDLSVTISGAAPEQVYELLTDGVKFGEVTGLPGEGGGGQGAAFSLFGGHVTGCQVELVPGRMISQAWRSTGWEPGVYSMVRFTLSPAGHGTRLAVHQDGVPEEMREHMHLHTVSELRKRSRMGPRRRRCPLYVRARGLPCRQFHEQSCTGPFKPGNRRQKHARLGSLRRDTTACEHYHAGLAARPACQALSQDGKPVHLPPTP